MRDLAPDRRSAPTVCLATSCSHTAIGTWSPPPESETSHVTFHLLDALSSASSSEMRPSGEPRLGLLDWGPCPACRWPRGWISLCPPGDGSHPEGGASQLLSSQHPVPALWERILTHVSVCTHTQECVKVNKGTGCERLLLVFTLIAVTSSLDCNVSQTSVFSEWKAALSRPRSN